MKIDLSPILGGETDRIPLDYPLTIRDEFYGVTFPNPVRVLGAITDKAGYIALDAELQLSYETVCDRCLAPVCRTLTVDFSRPIVPEGSLQNEDTDEYLRYSERIIDPDDALLEEIVLQFPTKHLCREDCKGLCPTCGKDLNEGPCSCVKDEIDPRMAGFAKLLERNKKEQQD